MGPIKASIVPGLRNTLISAHDLIEEGWEANLTKDGGAITIEDHSSIPLYRKNGIRQININSLRNLDTPTTYELQASKAQLQ